MTALALPHYEAAGPPKKIAKRAVKLRRHQATAGSASRNAVICKYRSAGSTPG